MDHAQQTKESRTAQRPGPVILTTGELAELLGLKGYQLAYLLKTAQVPPPRRTLLGRRAFYTQDDLERIRERLRARTPRPERR